MKTGEEEVVDARQPGRRRSWRDTVRGRPARRCWAFHLALMHRVQPDCIQAREHGYELRSHIRA